MCILHGVTALLSPAQLGERRAAARGPLAALADSLAADLLPLLASEPFVPRVKARLTRAGGRCPRDESTLDFDPFSPRAHRCPRCGGIFEGDEHHRAWLVWYQLWLAERAVHGAALALLRGNEQHHRLATGILAALADRYHEYPNRDNVLGPSRLFFSTYLESIWLLQLCVAVNLLEMAGPSPVGARVRDAIVEPSAALIASYDEGTSNRQAWNSAALLAAALLLEQPTVAERLVLAPSGIASLIARAMLPDGSWYEGENYHVFAHRALWYGITLAESAGLALPGPLVRRFDSGFAIPFVTALPDFTIPARRDSRHRISLRQWRFAENCELGLARTTDARLTGALHALYDNTPERRDTGRARSAAEAERHTDASSLTRADLGWRSLLWALPTLPTLAPSVPRSALLEGQGLSILRRDGGRVYVALDYGHSGGGHGHPDRLNLLLCDGHVRWLDDMGTGSYVDASLHWYRSTLAHNALLVNGCSQRRVDGELVAHDERGGAGWTRARVTDVAPGVNCERTVVVMPDYLIDHCDWKGPAGTVVDLPVHCEGELALSGWRVSTPEGGRGLEDGFEFVRETSVAAAPAGVPVHFEARREGARADAWFILAEDAEWWRATAPGPPGEEPRAFMFARMQGTSGSLTAVWSWRGAVRSVVKDADVLAVALEDTSQHRHTASDDPMGWHVDLLAAGARSSIDLRGARVSTDRNTSRSTSDISGAEPFVVPRSPRARDHWRSVRSGPACADDEQTLRFHLGEAHYRRTEEVWRRAGAPTADVVICADDEVLDLTIAVHKRDVVFAPDEVLHRLDNENPDINGDGVQVHLAIPGEDPTTLRRAGWLLVPRPRIDRMRISASGRTDVGVTPNAEWTLTPTGYTVHCTIPLIPLGLGRDGQERFWMDIAINEMSPERERRRGQLLLSGSRGEFLYLQGDRLDARHFLPFALSHA